MPAVIVYLYLSPLILWEKFIKELYVPLSRLLFLDEHEELPGALN